MPSIGSQDNVLIPQHFGCLLYVRSQREYIPYDHLTRDVLLSCAQEGLDRLPPALDRGLTGEQKRAFRRLGRRMGFLDRAGRFQGVVVEGEPPRHCLFGPLTLHLSVTRVCQLHCAHCFASGEMSGEAGEPLSRRELESLFDQAAAMGCMRIALTGGEPLLRPDFFTLVDAVSARGIDVCLTTNGMAIDRDTARALEERRFAWINVSLDGAGPETNDAVRGKGTFERVTGNIRRHLKWRVPFGLSVTMTRQNLEELERLPKLARGLGAGVLLMRPLYPSGRGAAVEGLAITPAEYGSAVERLRGAGELRVVPTCGEAASPDKPPAVIYENFGCAAGNTAATVLHDGKVLPCSLIGGGIPPGELRKESLRDIWRDGAGFMRIRALETPGTCRDCRALDTCSGGCRARAWAAHGDLRALDPWCPAGAERSGTDARMMEAAHDA